jgi:hypothetical protein
VCPSAGIDGIPFLQGVFVSDAANIGRLPSACGAGSFHLMKTGITIRRKIAGKMLEKKK